MSNAARSGVPFFLVLILVLVALAGGAAAGVLGYIWVTGGSGEPSLSVEDALATREASEDSVAEAVGTAMADVANTIIAEAVAVAVADAVDASVSAAMEAAAAVSEPIEFSIVAAESQASFIIDEDLRGVRTTVTGVTSEVAGSIMVDRANPSASSIGGILINARTLETDESMRNRALRSRILYSAQDENEFIVFDPQGIGDFSTETIAVGDAVSFNVTGDLTVTGVTRSVTFATEVTLVSESEMRGSASVTLPYADFGLVIPNVPSVSWVADDVELRLDFVARAG